MRILAVGLLAFPEPVVSGVLGLALLGVSFVLPEGNTDEGRACSCGCDYHRCIVHGKHSMGAGALVHERRWVVPAVKTATVFPMERYGTVVTGPMEPAGSLRNATIGGCGRHPYSWHNWPKLEGALLRRLSGYGTAAAVRFEPKRCAASKA